MKILPSAVLFACTENSIRSPMAEGILKYYQGHRIYVDSVGVRKSEVNGFAVAVMEEIGIDIGGHKSKTFGDLEDTSFDCVISLSPEAQHSAVELTRFMSCEVFFWNTFDPSIIHGSRDSILEAYRQVRDTLLNKIQNEFPQEGEVKL
ncbi:MAG: arsenate reductase ArsC [Rhodospirillaceae bacterium]|jgi:protein-tyrosine-phosphatase